MNLQLLQQMCGIHAPSGNETAMTDFLLNYIDNQKANWKTQPQIFYGDDFQNCIILVFGKPRTAVYAHIDNIGFMVRYNHQLIMVGKPYAHAGYHLHGKDSRGEVECFIKIDEDTDQLLYTSEREIDRGTDLSFKMSFKETDDYVQSCYLDNRLGVLNALTLCETIEHGAIAFTCWEEHGGGSAAYCAKFLFEKFGIKQALISDITWVTEGVQSGKGVAVSLRDVGIPRRVFVNSIATLLQKNSIPYQLEVEASGGSDGTEIQKLAIPIDWCFVGAPSEAAHTPDEKVDKADIESMINAYRILMEQL